MKFRLAIKLLLPVVFVILASVNLYSKDVPKPPVPFRLVVDNANILSANERDQLEQKLRIFNDSTSTQIAIVIDKSLEGDDIFSYSNSIAEAWGIGQKGKDNGLLIYIAMQEKQIRIQVGYGLEGVVTDAASKKLIEKYIKPAFKAGQYYQGLDEAATIIIKLSKNEFSAEQFAAAKSKKSVFPILIFAIIFVFMMFKMRNTGFLGGLMMGSMWGSFSNGSGAFGGSSSGGFGDGSFGGGSFGGGGAGGSW